MFFFSKKKGNFVACLKFCYLKKKKKISAEHMHLHLWHS